MTRHRQPLNEEINRLKVLAGIMEGPKAMQWSYDGQPNDDGEDYDDGYRDQDYWDRNEAYANRNGYDAIQLSSLPIEETIRSVIPDFGVSPNYKYKKIESKINDNDTTFRGKYRIVDLTAKRLLGEEEINDIVYDSLLEAFNEMYGDDADNLVVDVNVSTFAGEKTGKMFVDIDVRIQDHNMYKTGDFGGQDDYYDEPEQPLDAELAKHKSNTIKNGALIRITDGPFHDFNAIIDNLNADGSADVRVKVFGRFINVALDRGQFELY